MSNISNNIFNIIIFNKFEQKIFILPTQHTKSLKTQCDKTLVAWAKTMFMYDQIVRWISNILKCTKPVSLRNKLYFLKPLTNLDQSNWSDKIENMKQSFHIRVYLHYHINWILSHKMNWKNLLEGTVMTVIVVTVKCLVRNHNLITVLQ